MTKYNLLDNRSNYFRQGHNSETTLLSLLDDLYTSLDNYKSQHLILLDLSSAFDTLDFYSIIEILKNIGLKYIPFLWFKNSLFNKLFSRKINNSISSVQHSIKYGFLKDTYFPHYSLYFLTPIQYIFNKYPDINYNLNADDIELHSNIYSIDQVQNGLTDLHNCLTTDDLLLKSTKTELINIFTAKINIQPVFLTIFINDMPIKSFDSTKYLGVKFDNKFFHWNRLPSNYTTYINYDLT